MPEYLYFNLSGVLWALTVFAATYFHRQIGLITLMLVSALCFIEIGNPNYSENVDRKTAQLMLEHWNFSCRLTFVLSVILFFAAILLKRELKRKSRQV